MEETDRDREREMRGPVSKERTPYKLIGQMVRYPERSEIFLNHMEIHLKSVSF